MLGKVISLGQLENIVKKTCSSSHVCVCSLPYIMLLLFLNQIVISFLDKKTVANESWIKSR